MPRVTPWRKIICLVSGRKPRREMQIDVDGPTKNGYVVHISREDPDGRHYRLLTLDPENATRLGVSLIVAAEDIAAQLDR